MVVTIRASRDGDVRLPQSIAQEAGIEPGDEVVVEIIGPGSIAMRTRHRLTLEEAIRRWRVDEPYDEATIREAAYDDAARETMGRDFDQHDE